MSDAAAARPGLMLGPGVQRHGMVGKSLLGSAELAATSSSAVDHNSVFRSCSRSRKAVLGLRKSHPCCRGGYEHRI